MVNPVIDCMDDVTDVKTSFTEALGTTWSKYYCQYQKENHILTMIPYNQTTGKGVGYHFYTPSTCSVTAV